MTMWVHEVQEAGGAVSVPPGGRESIEVRDFGRVDRGACRLVSRSRGLGTQTCEKLPEGGAGVYIHV